MLALLLIGCITTEAEPGQGQVKRTTVVDSGTPLPPSEFVANVEEAGFTVVDGLFTISDYSGCCDDNAKCLGNNPATPYGTWAVPPGEGEDRNHYDPFAPWYDLPADMQSTFRLREDEALVWLGTAPPEARYFSVRSYLGTRVRENGTTYGPLASLGPSNNHIKIAEQFGEPIWDKPLAVVTSANADVEEEIVQLLEASGWDRRHVVLDRLPLPLLRLGLHNEGDTIQVVSRAALYTDPEAGQAWLDNPGAKVFRITPDIERQTARHPKPVFPRRGTGESEAFLQDAVDDLEKVLRSRYKMGLAREAGARWQETLSCIYTLDTCAGDLSDRLAATSNDFQIDPLDPEEKMIVWGINHTATGKASYSNITVTSEDHGIGVVSQTDLAMPGSAAWFGYEGPEADLLYAFVVSRDCSQEDGAPCMEVPLGCPGVEAEEAMRLTGRAYLEPATAMAPHEEELVIFRAAKVK